MDGVTTLRERLTADPSGSGLAGWMVATMAVMKAAAMAEKTAHLKVGLKGRSMALQMVVTKEILKVVWKAASTARR
jgi:hypothetical protein